VFPAPRITSHFIDFFRSLHRLDFKAILDLAGITGYDFAAPSDLFIGSCSVRPATPVVLLAVRLVIRRSEVRHDLQWLRLRLNGRSGFLPFALRLLERLGRGRVVVLPRI
jgi:hypothetical protein